MKCPHCDETLQMAERSGIEIDYCPTCRGVWLDRGELDKLLSRSGTQPAPPPYSGAAPAAVRDPRIGVDHDDLRRRDDDDDDYRDGRPRKRKRFGSILEDLFDF